MLKGFINTSNNTPLTSKERDNDNVYKVSKNENEMNIEDMSEEKLAQKTDQKKPQPHVYKCSKNNINLNCHRKAYERNR